MYTFVNLVLRGTALLLLPVYAHSLTVAEFGIVGIAVTVQLLTAMLCLFGMDSTLTRLYLNAETEEERQRLCGSVLVFAFGVTLPVLVVLDILGRSGVIDPFDGIPWSPYLSYAIWIGYLTSLSSLLVAVQVAEQKPRPVLYLRACQAVMNIAAAIVLVVVLDGGVEGVLQSTLAAFSIPALISVVALARMSRLRWSWAYIRRSLGFGIAVVPHSAAQWALSMGQRLVLQRGVTPTQLGHFTAGYSVGSASGMVTAGFNRAFMPTLVKQLKAGDPEHRVPRTGTYSLLALVSLSLALGALGGDLLRLLTPPRYDEAADYVPYIAFAYAFMAVYQLGGQGMWYSMRRGWMPVASVTSAVIGIVLAIFFVDWWGAIGAAISTVIAYFLLAMITTFVAHRLYPIAWEYGRWVRIVVAAAIALTLAELTGHGGVLAIAARVACVVVVFPGLLTVSGFWRADELHAVRDFIARRGRRRPAALAA